MYPSRGFIRYFYFLAILMVLMLSSGAFAGANVFRIEWVDGDTDILITPPSLPATVTGRLLIDNPDPAGDLVNLRFHLSPTGMDLSSITSPYGTVTRVAEYAIYEFVPDSPLTIPAGQTTELMTFTVEVATPDQISISISDPYVDYANGYETTWEARRSYTLGAWINPLPPNLTVSPVIFPPRGINRNRASAHATVRAESDGGPFMFDPSVLGNHCGPFWFWSTSHLDFLAPGMQVSPEVIFDLMPVGTYACEMALGGGATLPVSGIWRNPIHALSVSPDSVDFGSVPVGGIGTAQIQLINEGDFTESAIPTVTGEAEWLSFDENLIGAGSTRTQTVTYAAPDLAERTWLLDFDLFGQVVAAGRGRIGTPALQVYADTLEFYPGEGSTDVGWVGIRNVGEIMFTPEFIIDDPSGQFALVDLPYSLGLGEYHRFNFSYTATDRLLRTATVDVGPGLGQFVLKGQGLLPYAAGEVSTTLLELPPVAVGEWTSATFVVYNTGGETFPLTLSDGDADVFVSGPSQLDPGQNAVIFVSSTPATWGQINNHIIVNRDLDLVVEYVVPPVQPFGPDENRLGVYFDSAYADQDTVVVPAIQTLTGHLVLKNPSDPNGVGAWECRVELPQGASVVTSSLAGSGFDILSAADEFWVDLSGSPLPPTEEILLADVLILITDPTLDRVDVQLRSLELPVLPGLPSWTPAGGSALAMVATPGPYTAGTIRLVDPASPAPLPVAPARTGLLANVPNPFNPRTEIRFELAEAGPLRLRIHDLKGRLVRELKNEIHPAGRDAVIWDGRDRGGRRVASGAYYVRLESAGQIDTRKVLLVK